MRKKYTYIPKDEIESITTWSGKNIPQDKILDGAYVKKGKYADGGMMAKDEYEDYEMVIISKGLEKDGGQYLKDRYLVSAKDIEEAKKIATELWEKEMGNSDFHIVKVMSDLNYRMKYMDKYDNGGDIDDDTDTLKIEIEQEGDGYEVNYQFDDYEITGVLQKYYTGRGNEYEFQPSWFADKRTEEYYDEHWEDVEDEILSVFYSKFKKGGQVKAKRKKYDDGGSVEQGNLEMMKNQAIQVKHHAEELVEILKQNPRVDAWVVSLMDRATQNLSNITHYLDGELKHFAKGGGVNSLNDRSIIATYSDRNGEGIYYFENGKLYELMDIEHRSLTGNGFEVGSFKTREDAVRWLERDSKAEGYYDNLEWM